MIKDINYKKGGYVSMEFIFGLSIILLTLLICLGMFAYTYPRQYLEKEVAILAQQAKVNGGLTAANITDFQARLNNAGMSAKVNAYTSTSSVLNVAPKGTPYGSCIGGTYNAFATRQSGQVITIEVVVNATDGLVKGPLKYFGAAMLPENYVLVDTVVSERNKC